MLNSLLILDNFLPGDFFCFNLKIPQRTIIIIINRFALDRKTYKL